MIEVHLHGALAELLPQPGPLRLHVGTPSEALRACTALLPGFRRALLAGQWTLESGGERVPQDALGLRFGGRRDLHVLPAAAGAGIEIGLGWIIGGALLAGAAAFALMPDLGDYEEGEEADRRRSYLFRGAVNSTAQGGCVPLVYGGPVRVGSVLAGAGVWAERMDQRAGVQLGDGRAWGLGWGLQGVQWPAWRSGAGAPNDAAGADGDRYFRTSDATVWTRRGGEYAKDGRIGDPDAAWRAGPALPADDLGAVGDRFLLLFGSGIVYARTADGWAYDRTAAVVGAGKGDAPRRPVESDDTLQTTSTLRAVDVICEGEIQGLANGLRSVYVDGTPIAGEDGEANMEGVSVKFLHGLPAPDPDEVPEGFDETSASAAVGADVTRLGGAVVRTIQRRSDAARVRLRIGPLQRRILDGDRAGDVTPATLEFTIEHQSRGGDWKTAHTVRLHDKASAAAELTWRVALDPPAAGAGPAHSIRVTRATADAAPNDGYANALHWASLDSVLSVRQTYPHTAMAYIQAEAEKFAGGNVHLREYEIYGRIVRVPSNYDVSTRAYAGLWDGAWQLRWTDNPAWCVLDLLSHPRYGLGRELGADAAGLGDLEAVKWDLYALAQWCDQLVDDGRGGTEPRWRLTCAITKEADAKRLLDSMLSACRAALHHGPGGLAVVFDRPEDPVLLLGEANAADGEMRYGDSVGDRDRVSAVAVTYANPDDGHRRGVELVVDDALVAKHGHRRADKAAFGCASRGQAHRQGRHFLYAQEHESQTLTWRGGLDAAALRPGDVVRQSDSRIAGERRAVRLRGPLAGRGPWDAPAGSEGVIGRALNVVTERNGGGSLFWANPRIALPAAAMADGRAATWDRLIMGRLSNLDDRTITMAISGWSLGPDLAEALEPWAIVGLRRHGTDETLWLRVRDEASRGVDAAPPTEPYAWWPADADAVLAWLLGPAAAGDATTRVRMDFVLLDGRLRDLEDPLGLGHYARDRLSRLPCDALPAWGAGGWSASAVLPDGTVERVAAERFDGSDVVLAEALSAPPRPNAMCVLEAPGKEARLWRVARVAERGPLDYEVTAHAHDPRRYAAVEGGLNLLSPDLDDLLSGPLAAPASVTLSEERPAAPDGSQRPVLVVSVAASGDPRVALNGGVDAQVRLPGEADWRPLSFRAGEGARHELPNAAIREDGVAGSGVHRARARYVVGDGAVRSPWTESADFPVVGAPTLPAPTHGDPPQPGIDVDPIDGGWVAAWNPPPALNYRHTQVLDGPSDAATPSAAGVIARSEAPGTLAMRAGAPPGQALKVWARHVDAHGRPGAAASAAVTPLQGSVHWRGAWAAGEDYAAHDAVSHGGSVWICSAAHRSTAAGADGPPGAAASTRWGRFVGQDGRRGFKGDYTSISGFSARVTGANPDAAGEYRWTKGDPEADVADWADLAGAAAKTLRMHFSDLAHGPGHYFSQLLDVGDILVFAVAQLPWPVGSDARKWVQWVDFLVTAQPSTDGHVVTVTGLQPLESTGLDSGAAADGGVYWPPADNAGSLRGDEVAFFGSRPNVYDIAINAGSTARPISRGQSRILGATTFGGQSGDGHIWWNTDPPEAIAAFGDPTDQTPTLVANRLPPAGDLLTDDDGATRYVRLRVTMHRDGQAASDTAKLHVTETITETETYYRLSAASPPAPPASQAWGATPDGWSIGRQAPTATEGEYRASRTRTGSGSPTVWVREAWDVALERAKTAPAPTTTTETETYYRHAASLAAAGPAPAAPADSNAAAWPALDGWGTTALSARIGQGVYTVILTRERSADSAPWEYSVGNVMEDQTPLAAAPRTPTVSISIGDWILSSGGNTYTATVTATASDWDSVSSTSRIEMFHRDGGAAGGMTPVNGAVGVSRITGTLAYARRAGVSGTISAVIAYTSGPNAGDNASRTATRSYLSPST